jgi:putative aminopeptidase FrvX
LAVNDHPLKIQLNMTDILPFLKSIISVAGLSGYETPVANLIEQKWTPLVDEISRSRLGSIHGLKKGSASGTSSLPSVLIATHMDAIGLMVTRIVDGFIYVTNIGGVDSRVLPGTPVILHATKNGEGELYGVVVMPPANLLPEGEGTGAVPLKYLMIDTGLTPNEVSKRVHIGDRVAFNTEPVEMSGGFVSGHTLDNRASIAALTICLEELKAKSHGWDVWALASVQEETSFAGAFTSTYQLRPTIAIALDVTFGKGTGANDYTAFPIGKGVTLGIGPSIHPFLHKRFKEVAERIEIPVKDEAISADSSTDADAMQLTAEGIPTMVVSIPQRYMHTPVELVAMKDIQRAGRLLAEFVASLEADFINKIAWD